MDHYLRGMDNGVEKESPVRYFVMGSDEWRETNTWPPSATRISYYLSSRTSPCSSLSGSK